MKKLFRRLLAWLHSLRRRDKIMYIGGSDTLPPPLPREEETEVIARLEQGGPTSPADAHRAESAAGGVYRPPV